MHLTKAWNMKRIKIIYSSSEIAAVFIFMHFWSLEVHLSICVHPLNIFYVKMGSSFDVLFFKVSHPAVRSVVAQLMNSLLPISLVFTFTQSVTLKMKAVCYSVTSE
jgi:hypothetical protein